MEEEKELVCSYLDRHYYVEENKLINREKLRPTSMSFTYDELISIFCFDEDLTYLLTFYWLREHGMKKIRENWNILPLIPSASVHDDYSIASYILQVGGNWVVSPSYNISLFPVPQFGRPLEAQMVDEVMEELMSRFISRAYPVDRIKFNGRFRRAVLVNDIVFTLSEQRSRVSLGLVLTNILFNVFDSDEETTLHVVRNYLGSL